MLYVSRQRINCPVCILTVVAYTKFMVFSSRLPLIHDLSQLACSSLTLRSWFIEALRCINDFFHSEFPIFALPCYWNSRMFSATVIGLRRKWCFLQFLTEKNETFLHQRHLPYKIIKKEREISGVAWTLLDREEHRLIMQV